MPMKIRKYVIILSVISLTNGSLAFTGEKKITFDQVNTILGMDIEKLLRDSLKYKDSEFRSHATLYLTRTNFSSAKRTKEDYLLKANIKAEWWKNNTTLIVGFIKESKAYRPVFCWEGGNKSYNANPKLIDIDSDQKMEILIEEDYSGNQSTAMRVDIWRFNGSQFESIFSEGLDEGYTSCPYSTSNEYHFVKSKNNPKLLDICFIVKTSIDMPGKIIQEYWSNNQRNLKLPKPFRGKYVFSFDGTTYVSDKDVYDYKKFFDEFLGN